MKRFATDEEWRATAVDLAIRHHERVFNDHSTVEQLLADAEKIDDYIRLGALPPSTTDNGASRIDVQSAIAELEDEGD
jgi:hypothetical protein